jgi:F-type H+/Na+-transporting ATPase subunit alpha
MDTQNFVKTKKEVGFVVSTQDYLLNIQGLPSCQINDIIVTKNGGRAIVTALTKDKVEATMLDPERPKPGEFLEKSDVGISLPIGANILGRAINPLGVPLDNGPTLPPGGEALDLDIVAPGIDKRDTIKQQFYTGITVVDTLLPIGQGQRELILCEPRSGKEQFFIDIIASQKGKGIICIYAGVGRSEVEVKRFAEDIKRIEAGEYSIIVASISAESAPMITITPMIAFSLAEYYRNRGKNVLLIIDDFATHAKYSREINLLAGRVPGRESYPADIFYQHSSQMERAGMFNEHLNNGSITFLPVIETNIENFTNLIPTNVMSITDGHILFSAALRAQGVYPAIESDRSVTRVGRQTQMFIHKVLSDKVRLLLADFHELERYARFGSELSTETQLKIKRGKVAEELIKQQPQSPISPGVQIIMLSLVFAGLFDKNEIEDVHDNKKKLIEFLANNSPFKDIAEKIKDKKYDELLIELKNNLGSLEGIIPKPENGNGEKKAG